MRHQIEDLITQLAEASLHDRRQRQPPMHMLEEDDEDDDGMDLRTQTSTPCASSC